MNKTTLLGVFAAAVFATSAGAAMAQTGQGGQQKGQQGQQGQQGGQQGGQAGQQQAHQGQTLGQEQLDGRIVTVDKSKGTVSIQTAQHGQLEFKVSQAQIQRLSEGEAVRLYITILSMPK